MAKPVIFTVDDDAEVLRAVERDLQAQYGKQYRVMRANSGASALEALKTLTLRNQPVALMLVDQRMPQMNGVELLQAAVGYFPNTRRVLLTAYADTDAAIRAINDAQIDYYLMKPWDPPTERLYPVLDDLLDDWQATYRPEFEGVRVVGHRWSPLSHDLRDFLARNHVPYRWHDLAADDESRKLLQSAGVEDTQVPLVVLPDGTFLVQPSRAEVAEKVGLKTLAEQPFYDLIIVGAGPTGLAAAVYGASEGLRTVLIDREAPGGQAGTSSRIENYLGFPKGLSGEDLARRGLDQAKRFGVEVLTPVEVRKLETRGTSHIVELSNGQTISSHALLLATGVAYRRLDMPVIHELTGAGVYYGSAMVEAFSCSDEDVYIVGGANSAGQAAIYLSRYAHIVTLVVRGTSLSERMSQYLIDQIGETPNIQVRFCSDVVEAIGTDHLEQIVIQDKNTKARDTVSAAALFIFIGAQPGTQWLPESIQRDESGFILAGGDLRRYENSDRPRRWDLERQPFMLETSVPGIFVAGDVRAGSVKRVASGVGEGAMAVQFIHRYLAEV